MSEPVEVKLKIAKVTCLEDRAQVERRGTVMLGAGAQRLRIPELPSVAVDRSLAVELTGAALVDAAVRRQWKQKPLAAAPEANELKEKLRLLEKLQAQQTADLARLTARLEVVAGANVDVLREISQGTGAGNATPEKWTAQLEQTRAEQRRGEETWRRQKTEQNRTTAQIAELKQAIQRSLNATEALETWVELNVDGKGGQAELKISYLVPCAAWRPAYRATLADRDGAQRVELETNAVLWQRTGEDWNDVEVWLSTARPTLGVSPPTLTEDRLTLRAKSDLEKKVVEVAVREEAIQSVGGGQGQTELPGLDDGGEVRVHKLPHRASIPGDGQPHRVQLSRFEAPAQSELVCAPEKSPLASLVARFDNVGKQPLLAGPVELVRQSGFVGKGQLRYAGAGEQVRLSFGSEDLLRVGRDVLSTEDESRLTGRRTTRRTVKLFASNLGGEATRLVIEERLPVSEVKEVEISALKDAQPAPSNVSKDGIARFEVALPPRAQQEVRFSYEISAAGKVAGL